MSISLILALVKIIAFFPHREQWRTAKPERKQKRYRRKENKGEREEERERHARCAGVYNGTWQCRKTTTASEQESRDEEAKKLPFKKNAKKLLPLHFARIIEAQWSVHTLIQNGGWPCTHSHTHTSRKWVCVCVWTESLNALDSRVPCVLSSLALGRGKSFVVVVVTFVVVVAFVVVVCQLFRHLQSKSKRLL